MAEKLFKYFTQAGEIGGAPARIRLAILTKLTSVDAKSAEDSKENLDVFEDCFKTITLEFGSGQKNEVAKTIVDSGANTTVKLRKQLSVFTELLATRSIYENDLVATTKKVTEALVEAMDVERSSIWLYNETKTAIVCTDLFIRTKNEHSSGAELKSSDFPNYFITVGNQRTLSANNAHTHPGTSEFSEVYLKPLGINSMLDVPIFVNGEMVGVVCNEHTGSFRNWNTDEENFAYLIGNIVGITMERNS